MNNATKRIAVVFALAVAISLSLPWLFTQRGWLDFTETGQIGDTIGGIITPFIAIVAAWLTFEAFRMQYVANVQIRQDLDRERFENKFYEMLRIHQANVSDMEISDAIFKRKCFVTMFYELRFVYLVLAAENDKLLAGKIADRRILEIAYFIFFYGIGSNSEKHYRKLLAPQEEQVAARAREIFQEARNEFWDKRNERIPITFLYKRDHPAESQIALDLYYYPIDGHSVRLGHYYRHLFKMVRLVAGDGKLSEEDKLDYVSVIRAQLSSHEQLLLYYNSMAWFPEEWHNFFTRYRLIKNLPLALADFGPRPEKIFEKEIAEFAGKGIYLFEEHERRLAAR